MLCASFFSFFSNCVYELSCYIQYMHALCEHALRSCCVYLVICVCHLWVSDISKCLQLITINKLTGGHVERWCNLTAVDQVHHMVAMFGQVFNPTPPTLNPARHTAKKANFKTWSSLLYNLIMCVLRFPSMRNCWLPDANICLFIPINLLGLFPIVCYDQYTN